MTMTTDPALDHDLVALLRERSEQILNAVDDGVCYLDPAGNTLFVNEAGARLLGFTQRELLGRMQHELVHHHYADGTPFPLDECPIHLSATDGVQQRVGGDVFWRKDGSPLHVDYTSIPIRERRRIVGVVVTFRDISAQQRVAEQELRMEKERAARAEAETARQSLIASERRYRALVDAAGQYIWTNTPDGRMEGEQPGWMALTGQSAAEYAGYGWADAVHPDDAGPTVEAWNRAVSTRSTFIFEHRVRTVDGGFRQFGIRAVPVLDQDGTIREWVGSHTDITDQRAALAEAEHSRLDQTRLFEQAPAAIATLEASTLVFRSANARYRALLGGRDVVGKTVLEALPELGQQSFLIDLLGDVIRTGQPYVGEATPVMLDSGDGHLRERYFDFVYQPITSARGLVTTVMVHAVEVGSLRSGHP